MGELSDLKPYYVYAIIDGEGGDVFYVGKGQDDRLFQHCKEVLRGANESEKQKRIAELEQAGNKVREMVIGRYNSEVEAFAVESTLIHWVYGIDSLTNIASGRGASEIRSKGSKGELPRLEENLSKPFYVYVLLDSQKHEVFYVGKGQGVRRYQHVKEVQAGERHSRKQKHISRIIDAGAVVVPLIVGRFRTAEEALAAESVLIHWVYGVGSLTNDTSGHGEATVRPRGHYETLQGIDEPELGYADRQRENRERNDVIPFLLQLQELIESECGITFDEIHTNNPKHTYLVKFLHGIRLTVVSHHKAKRSASVTIESLDLKHHNRERVIQICQKTKLEYRDSGRYARLMPVGTDSDPEIILRKFRETLAELQQVSFPETMPAKEKVVNVSQVRANSSNSHTPECDLHQSRRDIYDAVKLVAQHLQESKYHELRHALEQAELSCRTIADAMPKCTLSALPPRYFDGEWENLIKRTPKPISRMRSFEKIKHSLGKAERRFEKYRSSHELARARERLLKVLSLLDQLSSDS